MIDSHIIGAHSGNVLTAPQVGNKAANLARLDMMGLRVPPALVLGTALSRTYTERGRLPETFAADLACVLPQLERLADRALGGRHPLLLSVRSSPAVSMPGMLESVLNVGMNEETVRGLIRQSGDPWLAWDTYRRFVRSFGTVVRDVPYAALDAVEARALDAFGAASTDELDPLTMRDVARKQAALPGGPGTPSLPVDVHEQLVLAIEAVLRSWTAPRAVAYRRANGISDDAGTGVLIQAMVFGNAGPRSGAGVGFSRNPATGADELYVDFVFDAQGEDVVSGRHAVTESALLESLLPDAFAELQAARTHLERELRDMQDFEFTIQEGQLYFLQTRNAKRTPWAALQVAVDLVNAGVIEPATAVGRLAPYDLDAVQRIVAQPGAETPCLATGMPASPGTVSGVIALSSTRADDVAHDMPVILVRRDLATDDFAGLSRAAGMLTAVGGRTSHAAVVARQLNKPCVVGCAALQIDEQAHACAIAGHRFSEGDWLTVDGDTGHVYAGAVPVATERPTALLEVVHGWTVSLKN